MKNRVVEACRACFESPRELLVSGPVGSGKTHGVLSFALDRMGEVPGFRVLVTRYEGRRALREAQELQFCELAGGLRCLVEGVRHGLENGSSIDFVGFYDDAWMGKDYDMVVLSGGAEWNPQNPRDRAKEWRRQQARWEDLRRRVPGQRMLGKQGLAVVETAPGPADHWLKKRADVGDMVHLSLSHADNPAITPEYLERLRSLEGSKPEFVTGDWLRP